MVNFIDPLDAIGIPTNARSKENFVVKNGSPITPKQRCHRGTNDVCLQTTSINWYMDGKSDEIEFEDGRH